MRFWGFTVEMGTQIRSCIYICIKWHKEYSRSSGNNKPHKHLRIKHGSTYECMRLKIIEYERINYYNTESKGA